MKWFRKWIYNQVQREENECNNMAKTCEGQPVSESDQQFGKAISMTMYNATGGKIVKVRRHNPYGTEKYNYDDERSRETVYIIHPDENVAEALSKLMIAEEIKGF